MHGQQDIRPTVKFCKSRGILFLCRGTSGITELITVEIRERPQRPSFLLHLNTSRTLRLAEDSYFTST